MKLPDQRFWRGKRVFVTGHTGFKGSWLVAWLHDLGARVFGYALPPLTDPALFNSARLAEHCEVDTQADVRNAFRLEESLTNAEPEVVFHLAAQALVRTSYAQPRETFDTNVGGTLNLLEAVRKRGRPCAVVIVTSDKVYVDQEHGRPYRESDALGGRDPYSASKAAAEMVAASYRSSYFPPNRLAEHGIALATVRAGNVIGGGDWSLDRILADAVRSFSVGAPLSLRNPASIRPWQHVLDPLAGYLILAREMVENPSPQWCGAWNFGPSQDAEITVGELAAKFAEAWGGGAISDASDHRAPVETKTLRVNIEKAVSELPWRPVWNVEEAVRRTAAWYRLFYESPRESALRLCLADLRAYTSLAAEDPTVRRGRPCDAIAN